MAPHHRPCRPSGYTTGLVGGDGAAEVPRSGRLLFAFPLTLSRAACSLTTVSRVLPDRHTCELQRSARREQCAQGEVNIRSQAAHQAHGSASAAALDAM